MRTSARRVSKVRAARRRSTPIHYAFWLDEDPAPGVPWGEDAHRRATTPGPPSALQRLAERAALVVSDFLPTFIHPHQLRGLRRKVTTPVVAVESATVVPMRFYRRPIYGTVRYMSLETAKDKFDVPALLRRYPA